MGIFEISATAIGLAMDCFAVAIAAGIACSEEKAHKVALKLGLLFGFFQAVMFILGYAGLSSFRKYVESFDHWLAFVLLMFVGGKMILEFFEKEENCDCHDKTRNYDSLKILLLLSVATSIDSFAVGISFSSLKTGLLVPSVLIGIASFVFTLTGGYIGKKSGELIGKKAELLGGIVLVGIGIKVLFEHLFK